MVTESTKRQLLTVQTSQYSQARHLRSEYSSGCNRQDGSFQPQGCNDPFGAAALARLVARSPPGGRPGRTGSFSPSRQTNTPMPATYDQSTAVAATGRMDRFSLRAVTTPSGRRRWRALSPGRPRGTTWSNRQLLTVQTNQYSHARHLRSEYSSGCNRQDGSFQPQGCNDPFGAAALARLVARSPPGDDLVEPAASHRPDKPILTGPPLTIRVQQWLQQAGWIVSASGL